MKTRRHHNTKGHRQIRRGKCAEQVGKIATRLKINEELDWRDEAPLVLSDEASERRHQARPPSQPPTEKVQV
jgi:hypothetical protein